MVTKWNLSHEETAMADLSKDEVRALGHAVGLEIQDPELTEVTYSLNALLGALDAINPPELENIEPLPIILPNT
jgi:Asp-tRNA(Asn)/Glu-tRNA(Gln) amidotransferase C subunit